LISDESESKKLTCQKNMLLLELNEINMGNKSGYYSGGQFYKASEKELEARRQAQQEKHP